MRRGCVREILGPTVLLGCASDSIAGPAQEVEGTAAVSLWAGHVGLLTPVALDAVPLDESMVGVPEGTAGVTGWPESLPFDPKATILIGDPFTFPMDHFLVALADVEPGMPVVGGMATGGRGPGGTRLVLDDRVLSRGAVGVVLGPGVEIDAVVSQGCRPVGQPYVVTKSERNIIHELAGQPAYARFTHMVEKELDDTDRALLRQGIHIGVVIDEHQLEFGPGDFLIRGVLGADRVNGAIAVGEAVAVGTTVQFHVRDAETADDELRRMLADRRASGALLFTCSGRGRHLFGVPNHDAALLDEGLAGAAVAGFFANGEIGPVGGRNFLHGFTASVVLFDES